MTRCKSLPQTLDRTQPVLPLVLGDVKGLSHSSGRHSPTTQVATPDFASGQVLTRCPPRHRHQENFAALSMKK